MAYMHGAYGQIDASKVADAAQAEVVAAYIGTAPINLVRGYADADLINMPIKIQNMSEAKSKVGYSDDWSAFTLCEAFAQHFDNSVGNVGPVYVVNVLDPDIHRSENTSSVELAFVNRKAEFTSTDVILDTFAVADMAEGVDYSLAYDFEKETVTVTLLDPDSTVTTAEAAYNTVDISKVNYTDVIGGTTEEGDYTGLSALNLLYQYHNATLDILAAPGWSHIPAVYKAMCNIVQKLNGHWDGFAHADIPLEDEKGNLINTIAKAIAWKEKNGYTSEYSKIYWPQVADGSGRIFHLSTEGAATMLSVDMSHDGIPYESPSNKEIMAVRQYFGPESKSRGFDQETGNALNEKGITTAAFWNGKWVLWGPHTAAYDYEGETDKRAVFDVNIRMLEYITNSFQLTHGTEIDTPMTPATKDTVINAEQEKLDALCAIGALIGSPTVEFLETDNPATNLIDGDFVWRISATNTPPFKSAVARVSYTDEGFIAYFEE